MQQWTKWKRNRQLIPVTHTELITPPEHSEWQCSPSSLPFIENWGVGRFFLDGTMIWAWKWLLTHQYMTGLSIYMPHIFKMWWFTKQRENFYLLFQKQNLCELSPNYCYTFSLILPQDEQVFQPPFM
jgi:hypothetical protein